MKSIIRGAAIILMAGVLSGCVYPYDPDDVTYYSSDCHRHVACCHHVYHCNSCCYHY